MADDYFDSGTTAYRAIFATSFSEYAKLGAITRPRRLGMVSTNFFRKLNFLNSVFCCVFPDSVHDHKLLDLSACDHVPQLDSSDDDLPCYGHYILLQQHYMLLQQQHFSHDNHQHGHRIEFKRP